VWARYNDPLKRSLVRATRSFQATAAGSVVLYYEPTLDPLETGLFRIACGQQVAVVERLLGARLRPWRVYPPRLKVYLFRSAEDVSRFMEGQWPGLRAGTTGASW
jgi:hypothetical protein